MKVLVLNCGSSSIKYRLFEMPAGEVIARGSVERIGGPESLSILKTDGLELRLEKHAADHRKALEIVEEMLTYRGKGPIKSFSEIGACGHRVVHGGEAIAGSVIAGRKVKGIIEEYSDLAPLHNPANLAGIREAEHVMPGIPQVACFDTAFHQTIPERAFLYGLPQKMYKKHGIRKYGFHGSSHKYVAERAAKLLKKPLSKTDLITCHLGNGCSMTAVKKGKSVDTSMGFTPLEGLIMGTRTGDVDSAVVFHLVRKGWPLDDIEELFNRKSGLLGISGISNDVRDLEEKAKDGDREAKLALNMFAYRIRKYIGAYLAVLNGCDAVVLTGGIGENGVAMRRRILGKMGKLGIHFDSDLNRKMIGKEGRINKKGYKMKILVVPTNEELAIALETYRLVSPEERT